MEVGGNNRSYPGGNLSNFSPHPFTLDGVECASMEGFLQSLKFSSPEMQVEVCKLVGIAAKRRGAKKNWREKQTLYWRGVPINRRDTAYQELLDRAYGELAKNDSFRRALLASGDAVFTHSVGKTNPSDTVLTNQEFLSRLTKIRARLRAEERGR